MASLSKRIMKFVQSPQGRQVIELERLRARYLDRRR